MKINLLEVLTSFDRNLPVSLTSLCYISPPSQCAGNYRPQYTGQTPKGERIKYGIDNSSY